jgi:chorismate mutase
MTGAIGSGPRPSGALVSGTDSSTATPAAETITTVEDGRVALDAIDAAIRDLVTRRRLVSQDVQRLRRAAGGPRIEHTRENQILARYGDELGRAGVSLGLAVLEICRGQVPSA